MSCETCGACPADELCLWAASAPEVRPAWARPDRSGMRIVDARSLEFARTDGEAMTVNVWRVKTDDKATEDAIERLVAFGEQVTRGHVLLLLEHDDFTGCSGSMPAAQMLVATMGDLVEHEHELDPESSSPFAVLESVLRFVFTVADGPLVIGPAADA